ncbi:ATP-binding protein [Hespellia stercorisuis]|uniref:Circadian input-output histidine kinase CikA n=1 Tax=Hespellia stercorisuis DSM 15480 TaxID=1121950 RepID=A0A1M6MS80_9FIRM|nr:transporter substrate-binding domain-containing protein [Hespellia stercorisuis]SHJ86368.1 Signal transduction histidine kinase [Hespellia stercorisuis DSM 15480]
MRKKISDTRFLFLIVLSLLLGTACVKNVSAADKQIIRVAYFDLSDYFQVQQDGTVKSYDTEYLEKIEEHTDLDFEFVYCGTWDQALAKLADHEVDLVGTMQWTKEREDTFEFCMENYGYTVGELAALPNSGYIYEDYEKISSAVIGCVYNYVRMDKMKETFAAHGINPEIRMYENQEQLEAALYSGEIDIMAANSHAMHKDWTLVEKFLYSPFYFVSWKGNEQLTDKIDEAIIEMNLYDTDFDDQLLQDYFQALLGSPFSKEEYDLIAQNEVYTIYFDGSTKPLAWYEEEDGAMHGTLVDICDQLREKTGLNLEIKKRSDEDRDSEETIVTYRTLYYGVEDIEQQAGVTNSILDTTFNLYHKTGDPYNERGKYTIAVVKNRDGLRKYLEEKYPECTLVEYGTPKECVESILSDRTDLAYLNASVAENIITEEVLTGVMQIPTDEVDFGIGLQFQGENSELLADIVNKGMKLVDQDAVEEASLQYALGTAPQITLAYMVREHAELAIGIFVFVIGVLVSLIVLLFYAKFMRRERDRIEKLDQERTDFFARMSHDMRTPMNGILGMIALTEQTEDCSEIKSNMKKAKASGQYMLSLINDTLDLQRLESGKLKFNLQIVRAEDFMESALSMVCATAEQKRIQIHLENQGMDLTSFVRIDPIRVKQIFTNLLSNAIKFTPEGGTIEVIMKEIKRDNTRAYERIQIRDTGVGMSREFKEHQLFKAYSQEKNTMSDQYAGSGLGLAITKNLVDLMGGRIEVESELGEGTTFSVYLNFELVENEEAIQSIRQQKEQASRVENSLVGTRILLCEDHPLNAEIARRLLEKVGCEVVWTEDGKKGVEAFASSEPYYFDVILMDIRMPVMNGLEAARTIRALDREDAGKVPILAMTANAYDSDIQQSKEAGMNEHLAKPIEPQVLYEAVERQIGNRIQSSGLNEK